MWTSLGRVDLHAFSLFLKVDLGFLPGLQNCYSTPRWWSSPHVFFVLKVKHLGHVSQVFALRHGPFRTGLSVWCSWVDFPVAPMVSSPIAPPDDVTSKLVPRHETPGFFPEVGAWTAWISCLSFVAWRPHGIPMLKKHEGADDAVTAPLTCGFGFTRAETAVDRLERLASSRSAKAARRASNQAHGVRFVEGSTIAEPCINQISRSF